MKIENDEKDYKEEYLFYRTNKYINSNINNTSILKDLFK